MNECERRPQSDPDGSVFRSAAESWEDARFGFRLLRKNLAFATTVILSLTLAIASSIDSFAIVEALRLRALPFAASDRLATVSVADGAEDCRQCGVTSDLYDTLRLRLGRLAQFAAYRTTATVLPAANGLVFGQQVSADFFAILSTRPLMGRVLEPSDVNQKVLVVRYDLWRRLFAGDSVIAGHAVTLGAERWQIVGVMPASFALDPQIEFWQPFDPTALARSNISRTARQTRWSVVARVHPGVSARELSRAVLGVVAGLQPGVSAVRRVQVEGLRDLFTSRSNGHDIVLVILAGCVLVATCANFAALVSVRSRQRQREFAMRVALGASHRRLVQQLIVEGLVVSSISGVLGFTLASETASVVKRIFLSDVLLPPGAEVKMDLGVAAFTLALVLGIGVIFSAWPALRAARMHSSLRGISGSTARNSTQMAFVAVQIGCALCVATLAVLFAETLLNAERLDVGYDYRNVFVGTSPIPIRLSSDFQKAAFVQDFADALERQRGVLGVGIKSIVSFAPHTSIRVGQRDVSGSIPDGQTVVNSGYFRALKIPILHGRAFASTDDGHVPDVAIVNSAAARSWFGSDNPIGQRLKLGVGGTSEVSLIVVGVVSDTKWDQNGGALGTVRPEVYRPFAQLPSPAFAYFLKLGEGPTVRAAVNKLLAALLPGRPLGMSSLELTLENTIKPLELNAALVAALALVAVALALLGIYGVVSITISSRIPELALRIALGAPPVRVLRLVVADSAAVILAGTAIGGGAAVAASRVAAGLLYGVTPADKPVLFGTSAAVVFIACLATLIPARRALSVDVVASLRQG